MKRNGPRKSYEGLRFDLTKSPVSSEMTRTYTAIAKAPREREPQRGEPGWKMK
jgi:hypothetical protein